jgi:phosphoenolpyruvate carboxylase
METIRRYGGFGVAEKNIHPLEQAGADAQGARFGAAEEALALIEMPVELKDNMLLFLRLVRQVLSETDASLLSVFDRLLVDAVVVNAHADTPELIPGFDADAAFEDAVATLDGLDYEASVQVVRAFTCYFHLANVCEENYRARSLKRREAEVPLRNPDDPVNDLTVGYHNLVEERGRSQAQGVLSRLEFRPVFTAHPTEARRKAVEGKIRRIGVLLGERAGLAGVALRENERMLLQEISAMFRTSPISHRKPTPVEEADTVIDIFDHTLFDGVPLVYRRFDDWELGEKSGTVPALCPAFFHLGSWIGSDRDGNPNVTAKVSRQVAEKYRVHVIAALAERTEETGRNITLDSAFTKPSKELNNLWNHQVEMSETLTSRAEGISAREKHRAVMLVIAERLKATVTRTADLMYQSAEDYIADLEVVQRSLAQAGAAREAYGPVQNLIWQAKTFGFSLVEMEFRQHSLVHARALEDIRKHGRWGEKGELSDMTREVLDTFRAIGSIQRKNGVEAARRYIVSFTKNAQDVANVYELARQAFAHEKDVPVLDVIPLFEQVEDLERATETLDAIIALPDVQRRLSQTGRKFEVMLGYSDSSKDAGPTSATFVLHETQRRIARWADENAIDLVLMHGRGGAVGRGGGPANRAVLSQPKGSVNCCFKLTEQGEVIFARYGNPILAGRHIESVAGATLTHASHALAELNTEATERYADISKSLEHVSQRVYTDLLDTEGFVEWFSEVTPLAEIGLLPIGSRPAKRGLGAKSLDDLRAIPWIFSWSQARLNLAAWYGLGTALESYGDLERLQEAYASWPLFTTFIDNVEMSLAKADGRLARMYLELGDRPDLAERVLSEMDRTRDWVLKITGEQWPLEHRRVLGPVVRMRLPFVNVLSLAQVRALAKLRKTDGLTEEERANLTYLILCTVSGVAAGLQNTG